MQLCNEKLRTVSVDVRFPSSSHVDDGRYRIERFEVYTRYTIIKSLGEGTYGYVVEAEDALMEPDESGSRSVAIKKLPLIFNHPYMTKSSLREISILRHFDHPNILAVKDIIVPLMEKDGRVGIDLELADVYVVCDKMDYDLEQVLGSCSRGGSAMDLTQRRFFLYQMLRGLKCIHSANVLHRDLKPSNILVNDACEIKICDFGMARGNTLHMTTKGVSSQWYRAPELLLAGDQDSEYDQAVDIWSVGCIMGELMILQPLFPGKESPPQQLEAIFEILGGPLPECQEWPGKSWPGRSWEDVFANGDFEENEIDLVNRMCQFDCKKRPSVVEALEHPHLEEWHDPDDEPECEKGEFTYTFEESDAENQLLLQFAAFHPEVGEHIKALKVAAENQDSEDSEAAVAAAEPDAASDAAMEVESTEDSAESSKQQIQSQFQFSYTSDGKD